MLKVYLQQGRINRLKCQQIHYGYQPSQTFRQNEVNEFLVSNNFILNFMNANRNKFNDIICH